MEGEKRMKNERVRYSMFKNGIRQTMVAKRLGISDSEMSCILRWELADEEQKKLLDAINEIMEDRSRCSGN